MLVLGGDCTSVTGGGGGGGDDSSDVELSRCFEQQQKTRVKYVFRGGEFMLPAGKNTINTGRLQWRGGYCYDEKYAPAQRDLVEKAGATIDHYFLRELSVVNCLRRCMLSTPHSFVPPSTLLLYLANSRVHSLSTGEFVHTQYRYGIDILL